MSTINFESHECKNVRPYLDSYLSDELLVETNQRILQHLETCAACAAVLKNREIITQRLGKAVNEQPIPHDLELKIRQRLRKEPVGENRTNQWRIMAIAAMVIIALTAGVIILRSQSSGFGSLESVNVVSEQGLALMQIGITDHIECAINHKMKDKQFTPEQMTERLGPKYAALVNVLEQKVPNTYSVVVGHHCTFNGREYVHLIMRRGDETVSVILTQKQEAGFNPANEQSNKSADKAIYSSKVRGYDVASFETNGYLAFVVSNGGKTESVKLASELAPSVRDFLSKQNS